MDVFVTTDDVELLLAVGRWVAVDEDLSVDVGPLCKAGCCHKDRWNSWNRDATHRKNSCTCTYCTAVATVAPPLAPLQLLTCTCKVEP